MLKLYIKKRTERIILRCDPWISAAAQAYALPKAYIQAVLCKELREIDWLDVAADCTVALYWLRYRCFARRRGERAPKPLLGKRDSSTGYGQVYAFAAINAINFAVDHGLTTCAALGIPFSPPLRADDPAQLGAVWRKLHGDQAFNIRVVALNLLCSAAEMTGRIDFSSYTPEEIQLIFTRYNANARHVTAYGQAAYHLYLRYAEPAPLREKNALNA